MIRALLLLAAIVAFAGCGGKGDAGADTTDTTETTGTTAGDATSVVVYFLRDGNVWPVEREVRAFSGGGAGGALAQLDDGPTDKEASDLDLMTAVPEFQNSDMSVVGDTAQFQSDADYSDEALAQVVYTLTGEPPVKSVEYEGDSYTRADFEQQTPSVLVESPLAFQEVSSPLRASGTANTYEATFSFEILDADGKVLASDFVTATSGSGERGTFRFEQPFVVDEEQDGALRVFELSAEDGSRINEVEIPLRLVP